VYGSEIEWAFSDQLNIQFQFTSPKRISEEIYDWTWIYAIGSDGQNVRDEQGRVLQQAMLRTEASYSLSNLSTSSVVLEKYYKPSLILENYKVMKTPGALEDHPMLTPRGQGLVLPPGGQLSGVMSWTETWWRYVDGSEYATYPYYGLDPLGSSVKPKAFMADPLPVADSPKTFVGYVPYVVPPLPNQSAALVLPEKFKANKKIRIPSTNAQGLRVVVKSKGKCAVSKIYKTKKVGKKKVKELVAYSVKIGKKKSVCTISQTNSGNGTHQPLSHTAVVKAK